MSTLTPDEISEILAQFFDVVGKRQYIGARYVPIFGRKEETSIEWDNTKPYEPLTIVLYQGNSFTSRTYVPAGVDITNTQYWANTGNYNAQVEAYRQETLRYATNAAQKPYNFKTVSDMQRFENIAVGDICHTDGFYTVGDNGAAWYIITNDDIANDKDIIEVQSNLTAVLISVDNINPTMLGASKNDETADNSSIINFILDKYKKVTLDGMYTCRSSILMPSDTSIIGLTQFDCGFNFINCDGIRINRRTEVFNITIDFIGDYSAIYLDSRYITNYWLSLVCRDITINHVDNNVSGCGIQIKGYHVEGGSIGRSGAYGALFENIAMRDEIKFGIRVVNYATSTSTTDSWFTSFTFTGIFIGRAETAIESVWVDTTNGDVPTTGNGPRNGTFVFNNCVAQFTDGVSKCFANIQNGRSFTFNSCIAYDYYHLRYDYSLPIIKLNANTNVCKNITLGNISEIDLSAAQAYISFSNASNDTVPTFWNNMKNVVSNLIGTDGTVLEYGGISGRAKNAPMLVSFQKDASICETYPELVISNVARYVGLSTAGEWIFGYEYTDGRATQFILTVSGSHAYPTIRVRRKPANTTWENITTYELSSDAFTALT